MLPFTPMWAVEWEYWGFLSFYFPKIGVAPGATPHENLKDDFVAQFAELNEKLHEQSVELEHIRSEEKLSA